MWRCKLNIHSEKAVVSTYNPALLTEVHWGLQRSLGGNFIFNTHIGLGFVSDFDTSSTAFSPTFGLAFGYRLF